MRCKVGDVCIVTGHPHYAGVILTTVRLIPNGIHFVNRFYGAPYVEALDAPAWETDFRGRNGLSFIFLDSELTPLPPLDEPVDRGIEVAA